MTAASAAIASVAELEAVIGKAPGLIHLKVIDHLDETALRWLAASPLVFAAFGVEGCVEVTLGGGAVGTCDADAHELRIPLEALDEPALARPGRGFGSLFLAPGVGETLRVNGRVASVADGMARIAVEECYVHCAKALIRSDFWNARPLLAPPAEAAVFAAASRFMALATMDDQGRTDLSPKGDPAGGMARLDGEVAWFADRPGNRKADSFRNIIAQPRVAAALLIPGSPLVLKVQGRARLTTDEAQRAAFVVQGKTPAIAVRLDGLDIALRRSPALARAGLWPLGEPAAGLDPAKMFVTHMKLNKDKGLQARLAGAVASIPGFVQKGLDQDYKTNLY